MTRIAQLIVVFSTTQLGCALDWGSPRHGGDAGASLGDAETDGQSPTSDASSVEPLPTCSEGCGETAHCNDATQRCECEAGYARVNGECALDPCQGSSAPSCAEHASCKSAGGSAECVCDQGFTDCDGGCRDLNSDPQHCGRCDFACAGELSCEAGTCQQSVVQLVLGHDRSCALLHGGSTEGVHGLRCWGSNAFGFLRTDGLGHAARPHEVAGIPEARGLALTRDRHCAIDATADDLLCWGSCAQECGPNVSSAGTTLNRVSFAGVAAISTAMGTLAGSGNTCALGVSGGVACWGHGSMIAQSSGNDSGYPKGVEIEGDREHKFLSLSGGIYTTCAVSADSRVACWGAVGNLLGNVAGAASTPKDGVFVQRADGSHLESAQSVVVSDTYACSVTSAGELWCWGLCGVTSAGEFWCWGSSPGGEPALAEIKSTAAKLPLEKVRQVALGSNHACALVEDGQVHCWGIANLVGLGADSVGDSEDGAYWISPQLVPGLSGVLEVKASSGHTCARLDTGAVKCWGRNDQGQLGDGTSILRGTPVEVVDLY